MHKSTVKGSYTVEAALILPCIFFIIIGLMYLGLYMHDKVKLQATINETLIKGRALIRNETDIYTGLIDKEAYYNRSIFYPLTNDLQEKRNIIYTFTESELSNGFFIANVERIDVTVTHTNIRIEVIVKMNFPFFEIQRLFVDSGLSIQMNNKAEIQYTTEFIRIFEVFSGVADKVEVVNEVLIKLQNVLNKIK